MKSILLTFICLLIHLKGNSQQFFSQIADSSVQQGFEMRLNEIRFGFHTDPLCEEEGNRFVIDSMFHLLQTHPDLKIELIVHFDTRGAASSNLEISQKRAEEIKSCITARGIDSRRVIAIGKGESEPLISEAEINTYKKSDPKHYEMLHQQNRRIIMHALSSL